jgi:hypothetical protein
VEANGFEYDDDASSMGSGGSDDDKFTPEEKRKKFLERNRLAASRCRQKKKEKMQAMQRENEETVQENLRLRSFIQQMELEMQELKQMLLMHNGSCDCSDIKQFIRNHPRLFDSSAPTERRQQQRQ